MAVDAAGECGYRRRLRRAFGAGKLMGGQPSPRGLRRRVGVVLAGSSASALIAALIGQVDAARTGATLARDMAAGRTSPQRAHQMIGAIEHQGDKQRGKLVEVLSRSLTTPIDREDLFRLSRSIDDVLDTIRDFVRESDLYGAGARTSLVGVLDLVIAGLEALDTAVRALPDRSKTVLRKALDTKKAAGAIGRACQYEIAGLFDGTVTAETLKRRDLARRLDIVGTRLGDAADALGDGAMKRWH